MPVKDLQNRLPILCFCDNIHVLDKRLMNPVIVEVYIVYNLGER